MSKDDVTTEPDIDEPETAAADVIVPDPDLNAESDPDPKLDSASDSDESDDPESDDPESDDGESDDPESEADYEEQYRALVAPPPPKTLRDRLLVPLALTALVLASIGVATWFYLEQFRPDQQTDEAAKATVIEAATAGTTSLLSYSPDTLATDFANAKTHLTGDFLNYYTQFTQDIVTPAAKQKAVKTSASVVQYAVSELHPDSAVVLLFLNQTTTSRENPAGSFTASSVKVGMKKVGDDWLISAFDPV